MKTIKFLFGLLASVLVVFLAYSHGGEYTAGAVVLGQGFAPYLLQQMRQVAGQSTPQSKLEPAGFLNLLKSQQAPQFLRLNDAGGHKKTVQVRYKQRFTKDFTDTNKNCTDTNVLPRLEMPVDLSVVRQIAIHIEDERIAKYENDASRTVAVGQPATDIMNEMYDDIVSASSALLQAVNEDLLTIAVANIGVNRVTGNNAAKTININPTITNLPLTDGVTEMLHDFKRNQGTGRPQVIGSGLFAAYMLQQIAKTGQAANGLDTRIQAAGMDFYHDLTAASILGANQILMYEPNAVQLVEYLEYTGFKAGARPGASSFGVISLPMDMGGEIIPVDFDMQLRYNDCPTTLTDAYYGTTLNLEKGFNIIISKQCGLWTIPTGAYRATDQLNGNRGSYRYAVTNA